MKKKEQRKVQYKKETQLPLCVTADSTFLLTIVATFFLQSHAVGVCLFKRSKLSKPWPFQRSSFMHAFAPAVPADSLGGQLICSLS